MGLLVKLWLTFLLLDVLVLSGAMLFDMATGLRHTDTLQTVVVAAGTTFAAGIAGPLMIGLFVLIWLG